MLAGFASAGIRYDFAVMRLQGSPPAPSPLPVQGPPPVTDPPSAARAITADLLRVGARKRRPYWEVMVRYAGSGALKQQFRCPFQRPRYSGIRVSTLDADRDGGADAVVLTAQRGNRTVTRTLPG